MNSLLDVIKLSVYTVLPLIRLETSLITSSMIVLKFDFHYSSHQNLKLNLEMICRQLDELIRFPRKNLIFNLEGPT